MGRKKHAGRGGMTKETRVLYDHSPVGATHIDDSDDENVDENDEEDEELQSKADRKNLSVKLAMWEFGQNDIQRDSGSKMRRLGYAEKIKIGQTFPGIVLSSETSVIMSPSDKEIVEKHGIAGINCSWNRLSEIPFDALGRNRNQRILPLLYAANTVNYGKPSKLNTAEAMAASLYITGFKEDAITMLEPFSYGREFLRMNQIALDAYSTAKDSTEVHQIQDQFIQETQAFKNEKDMKKANRMTGGGSVVSDYLDEMDLPPMDSNEEEYEYENEYEEEQTVENEQINVKDDKIPKEI